MITSMLHDVRYALRQLFRSPAFAIAAILTLGLGIGATTAIFSVINGLLLRPSAGIERFDEIVSIYTSDYSGPEFGSSSLADMSDFAEGTAALTGVGGYSPTPLVVSEEEGSAGADMMLGALVTPNFFNLLGADASLGRTFAADEGTPGGRNDVVVLGHDYWRSRFGSDAGVVGETVRLSGIPFTVIGVAGQGFRGLLPALQPAFYIPTGAPGATSDRADQRGSRRFIAFGRLAEGATSDQAEAQLRTVAAGLFEEYPQEWTNLRGESRSVTLVPARNALIPPQFRGVAFGFGGLLLAIAGGVLLIGCANLANLLLARATGRRREIGVRLAIGARRRRIARQLLTESMVLAALGSLLGMLIAWSGTRALATFVTGLPLPFSLTVDIAPDVRVFAFAAISTLIAGVLSGLAPALLSTRKPLSLSLKRDDSRGHRIGARGILAAGQIAIAVLLLAAGGLLLRSLISARSIDPGFEATGLLSVSLATDDAADGPADRAVAQQELVDRIRALPGVSTVSFASSLPLSAGDGRRGFRPIGYTPAPAEDMEINWSDAGEGFFRTIGTPILAGREFVAEDRIGGPLAAVVNQEFARRYLEGSDPIGQRLISGADTLTVVGVAADGKYVTLGEDPLPFVWRAASQSPPTSLTLLIRSTGDARGLAEPVRRTVAEVDRDAAVTGIAFADEHLSFVLLPQRTGALLLGMLGLVGLALAALGVYAVMAYAVRQRTREFGIRLALGARPQDLTRMVVRQGMLICGAGALIGLALAAGASRLMTFLLFGVQPLDPITFAIVATIVFAVAWLSNWLPARRTARADPLQSLRFD